MEKQKLLKCIEKITKVLGPIIEKDPEIIDFMEQSELTKDQRLAVELWFASATIVSSFNENNKDAAIIIKKAMQNMKYVEKFLDEECDIEDPHDILMDEFKDNCDEWFQIIKKDPNFKPFLKSSNSSNEVEDKEEKQGNSNLPKWFNGDMQASMHFMAQVFANEEDVQDFLKVVKDDDFKERTVYWLFCNIMFIHLSKCIEGKEELPKFGPFSKDPDFALSFFKKESNNLAKMFKESVNKFDVFKAGILDIIDTHYKEFVKKYYRNIIKAFKEIQDKQ